MGRRGRRPARQLLLHAAGLRNRLGPGWRADIEWDVGAGVGWKFKNTIAAVAGYRALGVDYNRDNFLFDVVQQGPILGLTIHF